jgi:transposase InsO family protein
MYGWILTMVDHFSGFLVARGLRRKEAGLVATAFLESIVMCFGYPKMVHSDNGSEFKGVM